MGEKKSFWQTAFETLRGVNDEGSSKRATAAYMTVILVTAIVFVFLFGLYKAYTAPLPTSVHVQIVTVCEYFLYAILLAILAALGLTNLDKWLDKIPFRGKSSEPNKENTDQK